MWNAFEKVKSAASKIGNEVSEALDKLTEDEPEDKKQERLKREEEAKKKKKADLERRKAGLQFKRDRARELERKINAWQVSFESEHGRKPTVKDVEANPEIYITHEEHAALAKELMDIPNMAAEKVATWFTKASEEVSKAVHSGVDAFHDFVEQSKQETHDDTHKLLKAIGHIDVLERKTKELQDIDVLRKDAGSVTQKHLIEVKNQVHVAWEDIEDGYFGLLSTLNALAKVEDEAVCQRAKEQIARVERLLQVGDSILEQLSTLSKTTYVFSDDTGLMNLNNLEVKETKDRCVIESDEQSEMESSIRPSAEEPAEVGHPQREAAEVEAEAPAAPAQQAAAAEGGDEGAAPSASDEASRPREPAKADPPQREAVVNEAEPEAPAAPAQQAAAEGGNDAAAPEEPVDGPPGQPAEAEQPQREAVEVDAEAEAPAAPAQQAAAEGGNDAAAPEEPVDGPPGQPAEAGQPQREAVGVDAEVDPPAAPAQQAADGGSEAAAPAAADETSPPVADGPPRGPAESTPDAEREPIAGPGEVVGEPAESARPSPAPGAADVAAKVSAPPADDDDDDPFADIDTPVGKQAGGPTPSAEKKDANPFEWDNDWDLS
ncbi:hypothetical protein DIPPA_13499 [Diplonema papillatum]|nr:hypothetical protein DIPPA_13499 [Diplonema papillatum]